MKRFGFLVLAAFILTWWVQGQTIVSLGSLGEEGELLDPRQVREGPDGNIYTYDRMDGYFKVFSPEGKFLLKFGGEGQGPGEIQRKDAVSFGFTPEKKFYFSEFFQGHPWISITELNGRFLEAIKPDIKEVFGVLWAECLPGGRFLAEFHYFGKPEREKEFFYHRAPKEIILLNSDGSLHPPLKKANHITRISYESQGADSPIPFVPGFFWAPFRENEIVFSDGLSTKLQVLDFTGKILREIPTPLPDPDSVTGQDLKKWRDLRKEMSFSRNPEWWNRFGKVVEEYKKSIYKHHPNLSGLSVTPDENVLISGNWDDEKESLTHWLLNREGRSLASLETGARGLSISSHYIFFRLLDEDMEVAVFAFKRSASEANDLRAFVKKLDEMK